MAAVKTASPITKDATNHPAVLTRKGFFRAGAPPDPKTWASKTGETDSSADATYGFDGWADMGAFPRAGFAPSRDASAPSFFLLNASTPAMAISSDLERFRTSPKLSDVNSSFSLCRASSYTVARRNSGFFSTESITRESMSANSTSRLGSGGASPPSGRTISGAMNTDPRPIGRHAI